MMVLKTIFVSTFMVGTFASKNSKMGVAGMEEEALPAAVHKPASRTITLGKAWKLGKIDRKKNDTIVGELAKCKLHTFKYDRETHTIDSNKRKGSSSIQLEKGNPEQFIVNYNDEKLLGLHIPVKKGGKLCFLSILCRDAVTYGRFINILTKISKNGPWSFRKSNQIPAVTESPERVWDLNGKKRFSLGCAVKGKIYAMQFQKELINGQDIPKNIVRDDWESQFEGSLTGREFFYQPYDHSIGIYRPESTDEPYKAFRINDVQTQYMEELGFASVLMRPKTNKPADAYAWTIAVFKEGKPSYLRLAFRDSEDMEEFKRRFRARASEELRSKHVDADVRCYHDRYNAVYGEYEDFKGGKKTLRRRLMTRRRLALERLYPRARN